MAKLQRVYREVKPGHWMWVTEVEEAPDGGSLPAWWTVDSTPGAESALLGASFGIGLTDAEVDASGPGLFVQSVNIPYSEGGYPGSVCINAGLTIDDGDYIFKVVSLDPIYPSFEGDIIVLDSNGSYSHFIGEAAASFKIWDASSNAIFVAGGNGQFGLAAGFLVMSNLPTVDPAFVGQLWNDAGTLKVSA